MRAARIEQLLKDPGWNWCGFVTFFFLCAVLGVVVVLSLRWTGETADISNGVGWVAAFGAPMVLTLLKLFFKVLPVHGYISAVGNNLHTHEIKSNTRQSHSNVLFLP